MRKSVLFSLLGLVTLAGCPGGSAKSVPTFHKDVEPILNANCVSCHSTGQIAPFTLTSYADALENGTEIQIQTEARLMPPWHIQDNGDCQNFRDSRLLTDAQIQTIRDWFDGGMPEGDPADAPPPPPAPEVISRIDANLDMGIDYLPDAALTDDYRCFLVDPGLVADKFMTEYEVQPGAPEIVHHIILFTMVDDQAQLDAEALDGADGRPGYPCFGDARVNAGPIVAWAPGINLQKLPPAMGVRLPAGRKLAMQVHYNTQAIKAGQQLPTDRTVVNLKLEDQVPLESILLLAGNDFFTLQPGLASQTINMDPLLLSDLPFNIHLQGVLPHMHTRGQALRFEVTHADGTTECLANVTDWDFHWQQAYFYDNPVPISPTDTVKLSCTYNTLDETSTISLGEGTGDEMCLVGTYLTL